MRALRFSSQAGIMHSLLLEETWDAFPLAKAEIRSSFSLTLDGHLICDFYTAEEWEKLEAAGPMAACAKFVWRPFPERGRRAISNSSFWLRRPWSVSCLIKREMACGQRM